MVEAIHRPEGGGAMLDLGAEQLVFPIKVEQGGESYLALFSMSVPGEHEIIRMLDSSVNKFHDEGRARFVIEPASREAQIQAFDRHFVSIGGVDGEPTVEQQRAWLDRHPRLKLRVLAEGFGGAEFEPEPENPGTERRGLRISDIVENRVRLAWTLWDPTSAAVERVVMSHVLRPETAADDKAYRQASARVETHRRRNSWRPLIDHGSICALYDRMAERAEGCVIGGQPCRPENKSDWVARVPAWHKAAVVQEVFSGGIVKNA